MNKHEKLAGAMSAAFAEIEGAAKDKLNPHFKSKYADLGSVMDAIKPALVKHGLFYTQRCQPSENGITVQTVLHHQGGEDMDLGSLFVPANKNDAQAFGSALTYARRYGLMTAFGVPAEDDDGNAAAKPANNNGAKVDDAQFAHIVNLIEAKGADTQRFCQYLRVPSIKEIPASRYQEAVKALEAKPAKVLEAAE